MSKLRPYLSVNLFGEATEPAAMAVVNSKSNLNGEYCGVEDLNW